MRVRTVPVTPARDGSGSNRDRSAGSRRSGHHGGVFWREEEAALNPLPEHVAIIMDGNGRWAAARGWPAIGWPSPGRRGRARASSAPRASWASAYLTLYAFSAQNWERPAAEVADLMQLLLRFVLEERAELNARGIRLTTIGDETRLPAYVRGPLAALTEATRANRGMTLCLALSYGGRESIVRAAQRLARAAVDGRLAPEAIGEEHVARRSGHARAAAARPADSHLGRAAAVELPALGVRLRRALLHRRDVARLRAGAPPGRGGGVQPAAAPLRPRRRICRVTLTACG